MKSVQGAPPAVDQQVVAAFRAAVYAHYQTAGRSFPWRADVGPWAILVSEVMLQQTQTERVLPYWERWMTKWPTVAALHEASLEAALREWSGLGYNRRCRYLKDCARIITLEHGGQVPRTVSELDALPGIGPYTACAIACFAYDAREVFIETNIRAAAIHHFFPGRETVADQELLPFLRAALEGQESRRWHWALMDFGAALKKRMENPGRRSTTYQRQSPFEGSFRQIRGSVIRALVDAGPLSASALWRRLDVHASEPDFRKALDALQSDALIRESGGVYRLP